MPIGTDVVVLPWGLHYHAQGPVLAGQAHQQGPVSVGWPTCASPPSAFVFMGSAGGKSLARNVTGLLEYGIQL